MLLHARYGGDAGARNLLLTVGRRLTGYASPGSGRSAGTQGPAAELVVHPDYRRRGFGLTLARALLAEAAPDPLRVWAHGDLPAARALAARAGFARIRSLWTMRRPLADPLPDPVFPAGVTLRTFRVGADEAAWLDVNRRAFASHPEQGAWTAEDLSLREREPWFDPDGFFLAERDGKLAGFHWTKVHGTPAAGRRGVRGRGGPGRAGQRPGPRADPGRPALPARTGAARGHALRGRGQHAGHPAV